MQNRKNYNNNKNTNYNNNNNNNNNNNYNNRKQNFDSNGPTGRIKGSAKQISDKYTSLARDAYARGENTLMEDLYQHAEHYFRINNYLNDKAEQRRRPTEKKSFNNNKPNKKIENEKVVPKEVKKEKPKQSVSKETKEEKPKKVIKKVSKPKIEKDKIEKITLEEK